MFKEFKQQLDKYGMEFFKLMVKQVLVAFGYAIVAIIIIVAAVFAAGADGSLLAGIKEISIQSQLGTIEMTPAVESVANSVGGIFLLVLVVMLVFSIAAGITTVKLQVNLYDKLLATNVESGKLALATKTTFIQFGAAIVVMYPVAMMIGAVQSILAPLGALGSMLGSILTILLSTAFAIGTSLLAGVVITAGLTNKTSGQKFNEVSAFISANKSGFWNAVLLVAILSTIAQILSVVASASGAIGFIISILSLVINVLSSIVAMIYVYTTVSESSYKEPVDSSIIY